MNGILLVDKPVGWTSHDVVAKVRSQVKPAKVGHAGTLDPAATGLLIVLIGQATKQQGQFMKLDKVYEGEVVLGAESTTDDSEGEVKKVSRRRPTINEIKQILKGFEGPISQVPPAYSAIKVGGQRAYKLARKGRLIELKPRSVTVFELKIRSYKYPQLKFKTRVSSGTYIRSLARDIGKKLTTGGYLKNLRRTQIGSFSIQNSMQTEQLTPTIIKKNIITVQ